MKNSGVFREVGAYFLYLLSEIHSSIILISSSFVRPQNILKLKISVFLSVMGYCILQTFKVVL